MFKKLWNKIKEYFVEKEVQSCEVEQLKNLFGVAKISYNMIYNHTNIDINVIESARCIMNHCRLKALNIMSNDMLLRSDRSYINGILSNSTSMLDDIENILSKNGIPVSYADEAEAHRVVRYTVNRNKLF